MANMSYCRFRNTLLDLLDCSHYLSERIDDAEEKQARIKLVDLCKQIAEECEGDEEEGDQE